MTRLCSCLGFCLGAGVRSLGSIQERACGPPQSSEQGASRRDAECAGPAMNAVTRQGETTRLTTATVGGSGGGRLSNSAGGPSWAKGTAGQGRHGVGTTASIVHPGSRPLQPGSKRPKWRLWNLKGICQRLDALCLYWA